MRLFLACALSLLSVSSAMADPLPFGRGSWQQLKAAHAGQPVVVHFWGVTCAPCLTELPAWGRLRDQRPDMNLVMVSADPIVEPADSITAVLTRSGLATAESWLFKERFTERLYYEVDRRWSGELPRTILIAGDGTEQTIVGTVDFKTISAWLDTMHPH
jgi:thiol-disulfide isomerase/thioredoxin